MSEAQTMPGPVLDPLDIIIGAGVRVRDVDTSPACIEAIARLEMEINNILGQIGKSEENPSSVQLGWRTRAQGAIRWKKSAIKALKARVVALQRTERPAGQGHQGNAILKVIREDVGEAAFEQYVSTARRRYPEAFEAVDNGDSGETS